MGRHGGRRRDGRGRDASDGTLLRAPPAGRAAGIREYRQSLGRAILLGLEFLVAGDIIRTVVVTPTVTNVAVLALIVLVRTFLSMALELELEGRWPWQRAAAAQQHEHASSLPRAAEHEALSHVRVQDA